MTGPWLASTASSRYRSMLAEGASGGLDQHVDECNPGPTQRVRRLFAGLPRSGRRGRRLSSAEGSRKGTEEERHRAPSTFREDERREGLALIALVSGPILAGIGAMLTGFPAPECRVPSQPKATPTHTRGQHRPTSCFS